MTEKTKFSLYISILVAGILLMFWGCSSQLNEKEKTHTPSALVADIKKASAKIGSVKIQVVTIDGVDYLVAETYRGVGICRK